MKFTLIIILLFSINLIAQDSLSYSYYDKKTYDLYLAENWKELISTTKQAFKSNYNSYYLQMRAGIAYYNQKNYVKAIKHLEKAREYNITPSHREYLYYSYLYSGYTYKADYYFNFFSDTLKQKIGAKNSLIKTVDFFGGTFINNGNKELNTYEFHNTKEYYSSTIRFKNEYNSTYGLGLNINFSNSIKAYVNYNYLQGNKTQITKTNSISNPSEFITETHQNETKQSSFYLNIKYLSNSFTLTTALNIININDKYITPYLDYGLFYEEINTTSTNYILGLKLQQKIANFEVGLRGTYSNLNSNRQLLGELEAIYYPLGNKNLYIIASTGFQNIAEKTTTTSGNGNREKTSYSTLENNNISKIKLGFKAFNYLWVETQAYFGRINEYNEANSFVVYNEYSPITSQYRLNLISPITKHIQIFIKYAYNSREQNIYNFNVIFPQPPNDPMPIIETDINNTKINNSSIIGGIQWTF